MDLGFDFETAGLDHRTRPPLSLGLSYFDDDGNVVEKEFVFKKAFKAILRQGMFDAKAMEINKIDLHVEPGFMVSTTMKESYNEYDYQIMKYLQSIPSSRLIPVGFNVGQFDMRYVWHYFPQSVSCLHYQVHDLNVQISDLEKLGFTNVKDTTKSYAANKINKEAEWHNAVYDATAALYIKQYLDIEFEVCKKIIQNELDDMTN